ncbi:hypothetical protein [Pandoraea captiosa]|nr:hypothetical protein [Pandoraea captiosa]
MGKSFRFITDPAGEMEVLQWFRDLPEPPEEVHNATHVQLYFRPLGPLQYLSDGSIDAEKSPIVSIAKPRVVHNLLWTVGVINFRTSALSKLYPSLHRTQKDLEQWLSDLPCIYSGTDRDNQYSYYLEGGVRNEISPIYAFPSGLEAIERGRYFVSHLDTEGRLAQLRQTLRLRGLNFDAAA